MRRAALALALIVLALSDAGLAQRVLRRWPCVKTLVPHAPVYNFARMQEVWLDR